MPRRLGKRTSKAEMKKYAPAWGLNPPPDNRIMILHRKGMTAGQIAKELGTTSTYVEGTVARLTNPVKGKFVEARPSFTMAWEKIADWDKIKKEHPNAIVRTVTVGSHMLRIAYWD